MHEIEIEYGNVMIQKETAEQEIVELEKDFASNDSKRQQALADFEMENQPIMNTLTMIDEQDDDFKGKFAVQINQLNLLVVQYQNELNETLLNIESDRKKITAQKHALNATKEPPSNTKSFIKWTPKNGNFIKFSNCNLENTCEINLLSSN